MSAKIFNTFTTYSRRILDALVPNFSGMLSVKAGRPLVKWLLLAVLLVRGSITKSLVSVIISYVRFLYCFTQRAGIKYTVKYLKACVSLLMQSISGSRHKSTQELGAAVARTKSGLPRIIPKLHRSHITKGSVFHIRLWLTLLSIYRVLDYTGDLKIKTIIKPSNYKFDAGEVRDATVSFMRAFGLDPIDCTPYESELSVRPFWISTTSPTSTKNEAAAGSPKTASSHLFSMIGTYVAFCKTKMFKTTLALANKLGIGKPALVKAIEGSSYALEHGWGSIDSFVRTEMVPSKKEPRKMVETPTFYPLTDYYLGRLGYKIEPAGKIRVFAMVDCFTQWLLDPLHSALFGRLQQVPTDATMDQNGTLNAFCKKLVDANIKEVYSFDLSAATDRLPVSLQSVVIEVLTGELGIGPLWASCLVERWYQLSPITWGASRQPQALGLSLEEARNSPYIQLGKAAVGKNKQNHEIVTAVRYAVGQPMGALSSWAMLAFSHHIIVHMAALRVGKYSFAEYLVLGDDLVIADKAVAESYLIIAKELDIEINLSKSILSNNGSLEFAKRFFYKGNDVTGIPFAELAVSKHDIRGLIQLFQRIKGFRSVRVSELLNFLGHGYKALSRINGSYSKMGTGMANSLFLLSYPASPFSKLSKVSEWINSTAFNKVSQVDKISPEVLLTLMDLKDRVESTVPQSPLPSDPIEFDKLWYKSIPELDYIGESSDRDNWKAKLAFSRHTIEMIYMELAWNLAEDRENTLHAINYSLRGTPPDGKEDLSLNFDSLWSELERLETMASQVSRVGFFVSVDEVISLGKSILLKRARLFRKFMQINPKTNDSQRT